jgi:hypothetical protein
MALTELAAHVTAAMVEAHLIARPPGVLSGSEENTTLFESLTRGITTEVVPLVGTDPPPSAKRDLAVWAISIGTAGMVESALWPEQQGPGDLGRARILLDRFQELVARLRGWTGDPDVDGETGDSDGVPSPRGRFPAAQPWPDPISPPARVVYWP